ncbi:MAG: MATE family efflux transporter [Lachnospiraceae bacterium]|nr:MATE family efflux transporter [Lachnospiraceae bacterium]
MKSFSIKNNTDLTQGNIAKGITTFCIPIFLGQLLQQLYNLADAWVIGHFAEKEAFAAVSSSGSISFFIVGFFGGISVGGGVIISKYFGAGDKKKVEEAIHTNFLFGIIASVLCTAVGLAIVPGLLRLMDTPEAVMPFSLTYLRIIFGGVAASLMYNICMAIMRALGDSLNPLIYLLISSVTNVILDVLCVKTFGMGVSGAAVATVLSQAFAVALCIVKMCRIKDYTRLDFRKLKWNGALMKEVAVQGIPTGIQNSVISIGNMTIQKNVNAFGADAMSGMGAYLKLEGFVFLPINCLSMALPTYIGQNLGARKYDRAKKGAAFGILSGMALSEVVGLMLFFGADFILRFFIDDDASIVYGVTHATTTSLFFCLLAFSHCAAGVMRGCGKAIVPMVTMLAFWCGVRVTYVTLAVKIWPVFRTISWAYPLTWSCSTIVFLIFLLFTDWTHAFEKETIRRKK